MLACFGILNCLPGCEKLIIINIVIGLTVSDEKLGAFVFVVDERCVYIGTA